MQRTLVTLALALLSLAPLAAAQELSPALAKSTPEQRAAIQTDLMKDKLALSAEQLPNVQAINLDTAKKMEPVIKGDDGPLVKLRQARAIESQKEASLRDVLTPDQFQKFLALRDELKQKLEEKLLEKAAAPPPSGSP